MAYVVQSNLSSLSKNLHIARENLRALASRSLKGAANRTSSWVVQPLSEANAALEHFNQWAGDFLGDHPVTRKRAKSEHLSAEAQQIRDMEAEGNVAEIHPQAS